jgi:hypothetical protein
MTYSSWWDMDRLTVLVKKFIKFWMGAVRDPNTLDASSTRLIAWGCAIIAWAMSIWITLHAQWAVSTVAAVTAVLVQGCVAIVNRPSTTKD